MKCRASSDCYRESVRLCLRRPRGTASIELFAISFSCVIPCCLATKNRTRCWSLVDQAGADGVQRSSIEALECLHAACIWRAADRHRAVKNRGPCKGSPANGILADLKVHRLPWSDIREVGPRDCPC